MTIHDILALSDADLLDRINELEAVGYPVPVDILTEAYSRGLLAEPGYDLDDQDYRPRLEGQDLFDLDADDGDRLFDLARDDRLTGDFGSDDDFEEGLV